MIGPTGVGKTEIARRLARLAGAPFLKVEASKFTEVGYVGRDVESMVRDLVEIAINMVRGEREDEQRATAARRVEERLLDLLLPPAADAGTSQPADEDSHRKFLVGASGIAEEEADDELTARRRRTRDKLLGICCRTGSWRSGRSRWRSPRPLPRARPVSARAWRARLEPQRDAAGMLPKKTDVARSRVAEARRVCLAKSWTSSSTWTR